MALESKKNVAHAVRTHLLALAKQRKEDFNLLIERYALERMLFRLSNSSYVNRFILKGGLLVSLWSSDTYRPTRDADLLAFGDPQPEGLKEIFRELCTIESEADGLLFDPTTVTDQAIKEDQEYSGTRIVIDAWLEQIKIRVQFDIGFGDAVYPEAQLAQYPTMIAELSSPRLKIYPRESVIAEKFETLVVRGLDNSRMKDFYDLWFLQHAFDFDGATLARSVQGTFERRRTAFVEEVPIGLSEQFYSSDAKLKQWNAFVQRNPVKQQPSDLAQVIIEVSGFILPVYMACAKGEAFIANWKPQIGWLYQAL